MAEKFSLKDQLFNDAKVRYLAGLFEQADASFDANGFHSAVMERLPELELKARIDHIAETLQAFLPPAFPEAAKRIQAALPPPLDPSKTDDDFGDFIHAPLGAFVARNGLDHLDISLPLLRELTKRFTVEYDIRHFLNAHPQATMAALADWAQDDNYHVRRLVSEGTRPSLPWGVKVGLNHIDTLPFLDILHADNARFVTRSVANHLNDIAKKEPEFVVKTLTRWQAETRQTPKEMAWITAHALRTLVKRGDRAALELLGYRAKPKITVSDVTFPASVPIGKTALLSLSITAMRDEMLMVDYVIDFVKARGSRKPRVFKLKKLGIKAGETLTLTKNHRFLKGATTFTHFPGTQAMYIQINGQEFGRQEFELT